MFHVGVKGMSERSELTPCVIYICKAVLIKFKDFAVMILMEGL